MLEAKVFGEELTGLFNKHLENWFQGTYEIVASSGESYSYSAGPHLFDKDGHVLTYNDRFAFVPNNDFSDWIHSYFREVNKSKRVNKVIFIFENRKFKQVEVEWDQASHENSIRYYPKVKLDKLRAWYLPDDGTVQEPEQPPKLPKPGVRMDTTDLTLDKAFFELNKAVVYKDDPLWDGGYYLIKHNKEGWIGDAMMYLYDSQESKDKQWQPDEVDCTLTITEEIKKLFLFIQEHYSKTNPGVPFDTLGVEVSPDGSSYTTNFELGEEDVFPNKLPKA